MIKNNLKIVVFTTISFALGFYLSSTMHTKDISKIKKSKQIISHKDAYDLTAELPDFVIDDLNELNITNDNSWEPSLLSYLKKNRLVDKQSIQNKKRFLLDALATSSNIDLDLIKDLIALGVDLNKEIKTGESRIFKLIRNLKYFYADDFEALLELEGIDLYGKSFKYLNSSNNYKVANNDLIIAALLNKNRDIGFKMVEILESKGLSFYNDDYKIHISMMPKSKYTQKYLDKVLPYIDINIMLTQSMSLFATLIYLDIPDNKIGKYIDNNVLIDDSVLIGAVGSNTISLKNIQRLIDKGANVNAKIYMNLPMILPAATANGKLDVAKLLLENGADITANGAIDIYEYLNHIKPESKREEFRKLFDKHIK